ncbi:hypothetical protein SAMN05421684_0502 [Asanoa ishikariensis]|uniref:DUF302 domain-containing protein n=1 Tax=Asanoa ishikariensis TaxID=137265 RepID=A0A1H3L310_9ACTN|nr:hypothetical protein [Asanoa ishikariensis]SDY58791.1 hypothetical protein SAMN05421684_0502 [Asanoa ishikariensis]
MAISESRYQADRYRISVEASFEDFRRRYETAVPALDYAALNALIARGADWSEVTAQVDAAAPWGFLRYWSSDDGPLMRLAHDPGECVVYLMGNHVLAERMYRYDQAAMLYAPLRPMIASRAGETHFIIERPGATFSSFGAVGADDIAEVGIELDHKLAALLEHLEAPVPPALSH